MQMRCKLSYRPMGFKKSFPISLLSLLYSSHLVPLSLSSALQWHKRSVWFWLHDTHHTCQNKSLECWIYIPLSITIYALKTSRTFESTLSHKTLLIRLNLTIVYSLTVLQTTTLLKCCYGDGSIHACPHSSAEMCFDQIFTSRIQFGADLWGEP